MTCQNPEKTVGSANTAMSPLMHKDLHALGLIKVQSVKIVTSQNGTTKIEGGEIPPLSRKHKSFIKVAMKNAEKADTKHQHGAVIVRSGRVLATGFSRMKNDPKNITQAPSFCSTHAEIDALKKCNPEGADIYVARIKNNYSKNSRPCFNCLINLKEAKIRNIYFTI